MMTRSAAGTHVRGESQLGGSTLVSAESGSMRVPRASSTRLANLRFEQVVIAGPEMSWSIRNS